jgi:CRP-like cAMP-binding protein
MHCMGPVLFCSMDRGTILSRLEQTKWGAMLTCEERVIFSDYLFLVELEKDDIVYIKGEIDRFMGFLVSGQLDVYSSLVMAPDDWVGLVPIKNTFGHVSFLTGTPRASSVISKKDTSLLILRHQSFSVLKKTRPEVALRLMDIVVNELSAFAKTELSLLVDYIDSE